jgi:hypothetical protein
VRRNPSNRISLWDGYKFAVAGRRNNELGPLIFPNTFIGDKTALRQDNLLGIFFKLRHDPSAPLFDPFDTGIFWGLAYRKFSRYELRNAANFLPC